MRRAKIIATIGPATQSVEEIGLLLEAGVDVARLNFSHGNHEGHLKTIRNLRCLSKEMGRPLAILQDLQGVKIRTGKLKDGKPIQLVEGREFTISTTGMLGTVSGVSTSYRNLPSDVKTGDKILMSDGLIELSVLKVGNEDVLTHVVTGGTLTENQGINLPGSRISAPALTEKDLQDLEFGIKNGVDFVALSFVRTAQNLLRLREHLSALGADTPIIAKLEKPDALENLDEILEACEGIMVARGDLGVEISPERVPVIQKRAVQKARIKNKIAIIATQMLDSMIRHPLPTRAEASDVANAVFDGVDALMLSAETAVGSYPTRSVQMMRRIIEQAESVATEFQLRVEHEPEEMQVPAAVCDAATTAAKAVGAKAIVAFSQSGFTSRLISRQRPETRIVAFSPDNQVVNRMAILWGVTPLLMREIQNIDELILELENVLTTEKLASRGDTVVIISGAPILQKGVTNLMKLHQIGENRTAPYPGQGQF